MYSEKLQKEKVHINHRPTKKATTLVQLKGINYGEERIINIIDSFCKREDVISAPQKKVFELFDEFCLENNYPLFNHHTLGIVFRKHFGLVRKKARKGKELFWIYVSAPEEE